jgi:hypothetical protein
MFWLTETNISRSELSAMVTYEHVNSMLSSTFLQLIGGAESRGSLVGAVPLRPGLQHLMTRGLGSHLLR